MTRVTAPSRLQLRRVTARTLLCLFLSCPASAAIFAVSTTEAEAGSAGLPLTFTLTLETNEQVSGIQFDLVFPPDAVDIQALEAGPVALAADKAVSFTETAPGSVRAIVAGLNQNTMASGVAVAGRMRIPASASNGTHGLVLENLVISNPAGRAVPATPEDGAVTIRGGTEPAPPGCGCGSLGGPASAPGALLLCAVLASCCYGWGKRASRSTERACSRA